jgi:hypothetical protein
MKARWYDPAVGRFISEDPGRHRANWFEYCDGNPTGEVDCDGRNPGLLEVAIAQFAAAMMMSPTYRNVIAPVFLVNISALYNQGGWDEVPAGFFAGLVGKDAYNKIIKTLVGAYDSAGKDGAKVASVGQNIVGIALGYTAEIEIYMAFLEQ